MNHVIEIGNLTRDIELKYTPNGKAVANFTIAVADRFNKEKTDFIDCVVWDKRAELCAEYLSKGKKVGIVGRLSTRTYETQDGQKRKITEVVVDEVEFLSPKGETRQAEKKGDSWDELGREVRLEDVEMGGAEEDVPF